MKLKEILILASIVILSFACNNNQDPNPNQLNEGTQLKYVSPAPTTPNVNTKPFTIESTGVYDNHLYASVTYIGGEKKHEFSVNWDGNIIESEDSKIINLDIYHLTDYDNGTEEKWDSLFISLDDLNIPEELKEDPKLKYDIINTTNKDNHFLIDANPYSIPNDTVPNVYYYEHELIVLSAGCNQVGAWGNFWLKNTDNDSTLYMIPKKIDELINYTPTLNDVLKVKYQYTSLYGISGVDECDFIKENIVCAINIKEIEKIK